MYSTFAIHLPSIGNNKFINLQRRHRGFPLLTFFSVNPKEDNTTKKMEKAWFCEAPILQI
ncbi:hypothetical protein HanRHA438_Chr13g0628161 [Helianthus annuus]|nr:hypothetical protein HanRHA438_Chr13g0628161 [Helianthus annuus]